ncbi:unnamed protein product [Timema podura]|uniref:Uncharacterized protein n=1 Tax=Timema podura TaxID=61482 RepID=A0ABN7P8X5_TIMPD|nr:unnamed protein product [Timema podura]
MRPPKRVSLNMTPGHENRTLESSPRTSTQGAVARVDSSSHARSRTRLSRVALRRWNTCVTCRYRTSC